MVMGEMKVAVEALQAGLVLDLQQNPGMPMNKRLYRLLRQRILLGDLPAGAKLPATRQLADALNIARNTVLFAFEQLQVEGFVETRTGDGTYIATTRMPAGSAAGKAQRKVAERLPDPVAPVLSRRAHDVLGQQFMSPRISGGTGAFMPGVPAIDDFPLLKWQRLVQQMHRLPDRTWLSYPREGGVHELKVALSQHLRLTRALQCRPEQVIITSGTQQSLDLLARGLTDHGDDVWLEDPGYNGARSALLAAGSTLHPIPVDDEGLNWEASPTLPAPRLIYITPSHQYPMGCVMSLPRRRALLAYARAHDSWILEDDYDSEFRYHGPPLAALQGLDDAGRTIYMGTFSKVMYPGLHLAYIVVPDGLAMPLIRLQARLYREGQYPLQAALAEFLGSGQFASHIRKMRSLYWQRQQVLRHSLADALGEAPMWCGGSAGLHLVTLLPEGIDDVQLSQRLLQRRIIAPALSLHYGGAHARQGLMLGYAGVKEADIETAARILAEEWTAAGTRANV